MKQEHDLKRSGRIRSAIFGLAVAIMLQGCTTLWGPKPDIVSEEKAPEQAYSNADKRRLLIDQPQMLSGDYFRERTEKPQENIRFKLPGTGSELTAGKNPEVSPGDLPIKIGLFIPEGTVEGRSGEKFAEAMARSLPGGITIVPPGRLREVIAGSNCSNRGDIDCICREAALYPGIRMLVVPESLKLPDAFPGTAEIRFRLFDADLAHGYPVGQMAATVRTESEIDAFLDQTCKRILTDLQRNARIMPRHGRVFSVKSDRIYINAGKSSQLNIGDTFRLVPGGETVETPSGIPVGWVPGTVKGTIRVESFVGEDVADCILISGEMPAGGDVVLFKEE